MRWALAFHPQQIKALPNGRSRLLVAPMQISEDSIAVAQSQGWIVMVSDTEVFDAMAIPANEQSNPRRHLDDGNVYRDHGEA